MLDNGKSSGHRKIASRIGAANLNRSSWRDDVHVLGFTGNSGNRHAASKRFTIGRDVRDDIKVFLSPAEAGTKTGQNFIKNQ
ncbi:hypothetical protein D3C76_832880 [compost metagenome]